MPTTILLDVMSLKYFECRFWMLISMHVHCRPLLVACYSIPILVFQSLGKVGGAAVALHGLVVVLLVLALVASAGSIIVTLYNSASNPYETYMGPIGLYVCSGLSGKNTDTSFTLHYKILHQTCDFRSTYLKK